MKFTRIACLEDLLRPGIYLPEAFCDWAREPIKQGTRLDIASSPVDGGRHNLEQDFELQQFLSLVRGKESEAAWDLYHQEIPAEAGDYLMRHVPEHTLIFAMELPPWLRKLCEAHEIPFLDVRCSPLRFGRDLYVAIYTNDQTLFERIRAFTVPSDECRLEASLLATSTRCHQRSLQRTGRFEFQMGRSLVFIGQMGSDAALIAPDGTILRASMFAEQLRALEDNRRVWYKPHPYAGAFGDEENAVLAEIFGRPPEVCTQNIYQLLSSKEDIQLVALTSGVIQEAAYFDKKAHYLHPPALRIAADGAPHTEGCYLQIRFEDFISPIFWHSVLSPERQPPQVSRLPRVQANQFREGLGLWWDYSKHLIWERPFWIEAFERAGGIALRRRIEKLESEFRDNR